MTLQYNEFVAYNVHAVYLYLLAFVHNGIRGRCFGSTGWSGGLLWVLYVYVFDVCPTINILMWTEAINN